MKRAALYVRVSTQEQRDYGLSVETQIDLLHEWAKQNGYTVVDVYNDAGISARKPYSKRPALLRLLEDVRAKRVDIIVFTKLDRWFRSISGYYEVQGVLDKAKVPWKAICEDYETETAAGRLKVNIMLAVAQDEADRTSERIKLVFEHKRQNGELLNGHLPYGYVLEDGKIVKDKEVEVPLSLYFSEYLQHGYIGRARDAVVEKCGIQIPRYTAKLMLSNPTYAGKHPCGLSVPPYITPEQFTKISEQRKAPPRNSNKNEVYLFSGKLCCAECGSRMSARQTKPNFKSYRCPKRLGASGCPNPSSPSERRIEQFLLDTIDSRIAEIDAAFKAAPTQKRDYKKEIAIQQNKLRRLKDLYVNGVISDIEDYKADYQAITDKIADLQAQESQSNIIQFEEIKKALPKGWQNVYTELTYEGKRAFWNQIISRIEIDKNRHIRFFFCGENIT